MYLITWIATHLPTPEGWMAELASGGGKKYHVFVKKNYPKFLPVG